MGAGGGAKGDGAIGGGTSGFGMALAPGTGGAPGRAGAAAGPLARPSRALRSAMSLPGPGFFGCSKALLRAWWHCLPGTPAGMAEKHERGYEGPVRQKRFGMCTSGVLHGRLCTPSTPSTNTTIPEVGKLRRPLDPADCDNRERSDLPGDEAAYLLDRFLWEARKPNAHGTAFTGGKNHFARGAHDLVAAGKLKLQPHEARRQGWFIQGDDPHPGATNVGRATKVGVAVQEAIHQKIHIAAILATAVLASPRRRFDVLRLGVHASYM
jgi:hypothetical protein